MLGWRHLTGHLTPRFVGGGILRAKRPSLACVIELGEIKPARCDDTTGNHPNHFLLGFRAYALNSHTEQGGQGAAGGEVESLTAQIGLYSTILHQPHPLFGPVRGTQLWVGTAPGGRVGIWGLGFGVSGFRVWGLGLGFGVWGLGFRVQGSGTGLNS